MTSTDVLMSHGGDVIAHLGPYGHITVIIHPIVSILVSNIWFLGSPN